ncbi:MAG: hypothetical protein ACOYL3_00780 [Desulfuromonadaceae bacterium]
MMTKVRGGKGFDALFSRFFDEPGLKAAVDSLHDNFSSPDADHPADTPAAPVAAKRPPAAPKKQVAAAVTTKKQVVTPAAAPNAPKKQVVAPVAAAKPPIKSKTTAPKKETVPDELHQEQLQDLTPAELESISSDMTVGWSVELLDELAEEPEIEPADELSQELSLELSLDQLPVIDIDEPPLEEVVEDVVEDVQEEFSSPDDELPSHTPVATPDVENETIVAPVTIEQPAPVASVNSVEDDDDDHLIEDFFSRKGKQPSHDPVVSPVSVYAPVVPPFIHHQPALVALATPAVKSAPVVREEVPLAGKVTIPAEKSLTQLLVHPQMQSEDLSSQARRRPLSKDQGRIVVYLYEIARGCSNVETISKELDIDGHTVRESLLVLVTEGYLYLLDKKRDSRVNPAGFSYRMNNYLCSRYAAKVRGGGDQDQPFNETVWRTERPATGRSTPQPVIFSSSTAKEKETPAVLNVMETTAAQPVLSGLVGAYWEKEGLEDPLARKWCSTFGVEPEQMHQQLEWARFDLETNKRRETVKKDVISWFYDRLMITGGIYPRPANYRTAEELRAEAMQHQHESALSAQAKIVELEFENSLQSFLADPEAPLYQELLERVNSFALEQLRTGDGKAEEIGLDALFKLHWGATGNDAANPTVSFALSGLGAGQSDRPISLAAGWNLVGYDAMYSQPVHHAISSIATLIESIWGWSSGQWLSFVPGRPVNSLTTLEPGMGYWIKMKQPAIWTLP